MDHDSFGNLLADMIAAGGVRCLPARTSWPMHKALRILYTQAGRSGLLRMLPTTPAFAPCPEAGYAAEGADYALRSLIDKGLIREQGTGLDAKLVVDLDMLVDRRRFLMAKDPRAVAMLQRAGERWAALASTAANRHENPPASFTVMVESATA